MPWGGRWSRLGVAVAVAGMLVVLGHVLVLQRTDEVESGYLSRRGDSEAYVAMVEGEEADPPFRYRVLVPALAALLPLPPPAALRAVTYVSLFGGYVLVLLLADRIGFSRPAAALGVFAAFAYSSHLYNYHNPYLTDGAGFFFLAALVSLAHSGPFLAFALTVAVGVLARETTLFGALLWGWRGRWGLALGAVLAGAAAYGAVRIAVGGGSDLYLANRLADPFASAAGIALAWGPVWILAGLGLLVWPTGSLRFIAPVALVLLGASTVASFLAFDLVRMFQMAAPVMMLAGASAFDWLLPRDRLVALALGLLSAWQLLVGIPTRLNPDVEALWAFGPARLAFAVAYVAVLVWAAYRLRSPLAGALREKQAWVRRRGWRRAA